MNRTIILSVTCSAFLAGCYGAAPPRPARVPLPALSDDATIAVHSDTRTKIENVDKEAWSCPAGHADGDPACTVTHYSEAQPVTRTTSTATYGAEPINYAQFKVLTDPGYTQKLAQLADMSKRCTRANVPRWVGMGLAIGGLVGIAVSGNKGAFGLASWGALGGGGVSYGLGYYSFGGRTCNEARALYEQIDYTQEMAWESVEGDDTASEMRTLAERFNAARDHRVASEHLSVSE